MKAYLHKIILACSLFLGLQAMAQVPKLNSFSSATATIFLDFDGQTVRSSYWNSGRPLVCAAPLLNATQITEIHARVAEDYRPFNVTITTDSAVFLAAPLNRRIRIIVTPTSSWTSGVGGLAYIGSFTWGDDTPGFVFPDRLSNNPKYIAECCSHESGHTLGLSHQSDYDASCNLVNTYAVGSGTGEIGWAPIMGNSYYKNMTGWNKGPTSNGCTNVQDNLSIITSQNGFTYRTDDYSNATDASASRVPTGSFNITGIIGNNTDKDVFQFSLSNTSSIYITGSPIGLNNTTTGANLDLRVDLFNSNNTLIKTFNKPDLMSVVVDTILPSGNYYLVVSGTGNAFTSNYGSLGSYRLSGATTALPIHDISLTGNNAGKLHNLSWNIIADEPIEEKVLEMSTDGIQFKPLISLRGTNNNYQYRPNQSGVCYYRLKVLTTIKELGYSNIVALHASGTGVFTIPTFMESGNVKVNAPTAFDYLINDMSGRIIARGKGTAGMNNIYMGSNPSGIYVIQIMNNEQKFSERIIKQ